MNWGVFAEPLHRALLEHVLGAEISETGLAVGRDELKYCH